MLSFGPLSTYPISAPPLPAGGSSVVPYYFADRAFTTEPDDELMPNRFWEPRVSSALTIERTLPLSPLDQRRVLMQPGEISLVNADGKLDELLTDLSIDGRKIEVKVGAPGFRMADFITIFTGTAFGFSAGDNKTISASVKDSTSELDAPAQKDRYGGSGGLDGGADVANRPKPLWYGIRRDAELVLIDGVREIYQAHSGPMKEITDVSDKGAPIAYAGDVVDIEAIVPAAGTFIVESSARGTFARLGTPAKGKVTATGRGDNSFGRYASSVGQIVFRLVHDKLGWADTRFNMRKFQQLQLQESGEVGIYTATNDMTIAQMVDQLLASDHGWWEVDPEGLFGVGLITGAGSKPSRFFDSRHILDVTPIPPASSLVPPYWSVKVGAQQCCTDLGGNFADIVSTMPDRKQFLLQPYRYPPDAAADGAVKAKHPQAQSITLNTLLDSLDDAAALQARILALHKEWPLQARVAFKSHAYRIGMGATVNIKYRRYGLTGGVNCYVFGHGIRSADRASYIDVWYRS